MNNADNTKEIKNNKKGYSYPLIMITVFIVVFVVTLAIIYKLYLSGFKTTENYERYNQYYVMIASNQHSVFMENIYEGAYEEGISQGIYVDYLADNLPNDYTQEDLMKIAIASEVDGIILDADESPAMIELIDQASEAGIPVVTLMNDFTNSKRCSYVGVGGYEIGREYGSEVLKIAKDIRRQYFMSTQQAREEDIATIDVAILVNSTTNSSSQNVIISGIRETLESNVDSSDTTANVKIVSVDNSSAFSMEESIRDIFNTGDLPAIIICLDENSTTCVYQAVVDYNVVGKVNILGYYDSDTIINAVNRGVINSTIAVDTAKLGGYCVNALSDYNSLGATSQYYTGDVTLINKGNVSMYMTKEATNE